MKLLFLYPNEIGPYHQERTRALCRVPGLQVKTVEVEREPQPGYLWTIRKDEFGFDYAFLPRAGGIRRGMELIREFAPDAVVLHGYDDSLTVGLSLLARLRGYPVFVQGESHYLSGPRRTGKELLKSAVLSRFDGFLAPGPLQADYFRRLSGGRRPVFETNYMALDTFRTRRFAEAGPAPRTDGSTRPERYFLCVARFVPFKRLDLVIRAFARFHREAAGTPLAEYRLVILGEGDLRAEFEALARSLGVEEAVLMPGFKQGEELSEYYTAARAFLQMSDWIDCHPMVVTEALAHGTPCIVSHRIGNTYLVEHGVTGFVVEEPEEENFIAALCALGSDDALYTRMRAAVLPAIETLDADRSARLTADAIRSVIGAR